MGFRKSLALSSAATGSLSASSERPLCRCPTLARAKGGENQRQRTGVSAPHNQRPPPCRSKERRGKDGDPLQNNVWSRPGQPQSPKGGPTSCGAGIRVPTLANAQGWGTGTTVAQNLQRAIPSPPTTVPMIS